jgi:hypothetical protein
MYKEQGWHIFLVQTYQNRNSIQQLSIFLHTAVLPTYKEH